MKQLSYIARTASRHAASQDSPWFFVGAFTLTLFLLAIVSIVLARQSGNVASIWLPNALALATLLRQPQCHWVAYLPAIFAANLAANQLMGDAFGFAAALSGINALEILAAALLLRGLRGAPVELSDVPTFLKVLLISAVLTPAVAACLGSAAVHLVHNTPYATVWRAWWISDLMGMLVLLPFALTVSVEHVRKTLSGARLADFALLLILTLLTSYVALLFLRYPFIVITLPLLVAALRLSLFATSLLGALAVTFIVGIGLLGAVNTLPGGAAFLQESLHVSTALAVVLPVCLSVLMEQLYSDKRIIRESEQRFRNAMEYSAIGMALVSLEGSWIQVNQALCKMLGYSEQELLKLTFQELTYPEDLTADLEQVKRALAGEINAYRMEKRYRCKDGAIIWALLAVSVVRDDHGRPRYFISQIEDIDRRKRAEEALTESEARWKFALEGAGHGVWDRDMTTGKLFYSRVWKSMLGYDEHEIGDVPAEWASRLHPEDSDRVVQAVRDYSEGKTEAFECEYRMRHKNGSYVWIHDRAKAISRGVNGAPLRLIGTHTDITESRRLTEELFEEKERLWVTLHSIGDAVVCTDAKARVTFMNPVAERMTGWSQAAAIGQPLAEVFEIVDDATDEPIPSPVEHCLRESRVVYLQDDATLISRTSDRYHIQDSAAPIRTSSGEIIGAVLVFQDITKARSLQRELTYAASHDPLTGLPNRTAFKHQVEEACKQVREWGRMHAVCFIDLDRFKIVNDTAGHAAGDALLRELGHVLRQQVRSHDVIARLGGDEFALLLYDCPMEQTERIAEKMIKSIRALRFQWDGRVYEVGASIGATAITLHNAVVDKLMAEADIACYAAKNAGRNCVSVYHPEQSSAQQHHREIQVAAGIREALEANKFQLYAQEIRALNAPKSSGLYLELALRMLDEQGNLLVPGAFIPAAERYELMSHIDRWVISSALQHPDLIAASDRMLAIAINLSANSLNDPFFLPFLQEQLQQSRLPPKQVHFEITETAVINHLNSAHKVIETVRAAGCRVALDDFGTGLSSFGYLRQFPVDYVKIDGSFIRQLKQNRIDRAIVESIHELAHKLGAETVAEWVEDNDTLQILRGIGIDYIQGYTIHRPAPLTEVLSSFQLKNRRPRLTLVSSSSADKN